MITIDQIKKLGAKVEAAVSLIRELREENSTLKKNLDLYQKRIDELEVLINTYKKDQGKIEEGIVRALDQLDTLEDALTGEQESSEEAAPEQEAVATESAPAEEPEQDQQESELDIF